MKAITGSVALSALTTLRESIGVVEKKKVSRSKAETKERSVQGNHTISLYYVIVAEELFADLNIH